MRDIKSYSSTSCSSDSNILIGQIKPRFVFFVFYVRKISKTQTKAGVDKQLCTIHSQVDNTFFYYNLYIYIYTFTFFFKYSWLLRSSNRTSSSWTSVEKYVTFPPWWQKSSHTHTSPSWKRWKIFFQLHILPGPHSSQPFPPGWVGNLRPTRPAASCGLRSPLPW